MADSWDESWDEEEKLSQEELVTYGSILSEYFASDRYHRFEYERFLGKGIDGVTYLIKYKPQDTTNRVRSQSPKDQAGGIDLVLLSKPPASASASNRLTPGLPRQRLRGNGWNDDNRNTRIVLKIDMPAVAKFFHDDDEEDEEEEEEEENRCENEKNYLQLLQNCQHIVDLVQFPHDPLARTTSSLRAHLLSESNWFFEEYLENGTLTNFIERWLETCRTRRLPSTRLPNTLLWSIFLCLVKAVVAMAWPFQLRHDTPESCLLERPISNIQHNDIHDGNLMFGNETHQECHTRMPILKLIDFAAAETLEGDQTKKVGDEGPDPEGVSENIFAIGKTMAILVLPEQSRVLEQIIPERDRDAMSFVPFKMNQIASVGVELIPPNSCPGIDQDLKGLIIACLAREASDRPEILQLHTFVQRAARERDSTFYQNINNQYNEMQRQRGEVPRNLYDIQSEGVPYTRQIIDLLFTPPAGSA
ncbi:hypothetical protein EV127DRAFT_503837 [Xylaria flabelliformis]|nr:hypothetical protein EV127DRAFT_503837 [Xylaria flabelliformis]